MSTPSKPRRTAQAGAVQVARAPQAQVAATPAQQAQAAAVANAQTILRNATAIAGVRFLAKPLHESSVRLPDSGINAIYRITAPGVALVIDKKDGTVLAQSVPGDLQALQPGFVPGRTLAQTTLAVPRPGPH